MFNATTARQTADQQFEELTDKFALEFEDRTAGMTNTEKSKLMHRLLDVMTDKNATTAFATGQYAQNSQGQPAAAIGTGQQPPTNEQEALAFLLASGSLPSGVKQALKRLLNPQDPAHIRVWADGTPEEVSNLRQQVADLTGQLAAERDPAVAGSLKQRLAAATAAANPSNCVRKDAVKTALDAVKTALDAVKTSALSSRIEGLEEAKARVANATQLVS